MKLEHSFTVPVGVDEAWNILLDIDRIGPCLPGAAIDSVDGDDFTGTVKVKLGPIGLTYKGKASFTEKDATAHRAVIDARGRDARGNGTAAAKVTAVLAAVGAGTLVTVETDLDITGRPAQFGRGVMADVGNKLIGQFADNLAATIGATPDAQPATDSVDTGTAAAGDTPSGSAGTSASGSADTSASGSADTSASGSADTPASGTTTGAGSAAATGSAGTRDRATPPQTRAPTSRPQPAASTQPINLVQSAGPALAKRLAPLVLGLAAVAVVVARRRR